jgi:alpha-L-fucosidase
VRVAIVPAPAGLAVTPARVRPGALVTVTGRCVGSGAAAVPLAVRWPGGGRTVSAAVSGGAVRVTFRLARDAGAGAGSVVLESGCPGTALPAMAAFTVRSPVVGTASPSPSASASAVSSPVPSPSGSSVPATAEPAARPVRHRSAGPAVLAGVLAVLLVGAVAAGSGFAWRHRH